MTFQRIFARTASCAALLATLAFSAARADDAPPTPAAIASARTVVIASGIAHSFDVVVPQMLGQLERNVLSTRPDLKDTLHATLLQLEPDFVKSEEQVIDAASISLAKRMTEAELKETAAFFQSASGKKYVQTQPDALADIVAAMQGWQQKLSTDMMTRVRAEMKKKGVEL